MALDLIVDTLLPRLLAASVQSTLLVALVWALCRAVPRLSAATRAWLWWLVALQLVLGLVWSSPLALPLLPAEPVQIVVSTAQAAPVPNVGASGAVTRFEPAVVASTSAPVWPLALAGLWLLGLSVMLTRSLLGLLATRTLLRESRPCRDDSLLDALALAADAHGLRAAPHLRLSAQIDSPQLVGPWRPVLLLPVDHAQAMRPDELDMALTHELVHLQRGDLWLGLLPALAQHLFFFHPLVHLAAREYGLAREAACDAAVLEGHRDCAREYGQLLLRLGIAPRPSAGLASASPDFSILKRRLTMLQHTPSLPRVVAVLMTVAVGVVGVMPYRLTAATPAVAAQAAAPAARPSASTTPAPEALPAPAATATYNGVIVDAADMPAPPAAPAPPALVTPTLPAIPPAPPAPVTPTLPAVPPAPPAPVAAPAAPTGALRGTFTLGTEPGKEAFVLLDDDNSIAVSATSELREAQAARRGDEPLLWLRKGDARYVVRDRATIEAIRDAYADVNALGAAQGELGARQGTLGGQQGTLGARQAQIAMRMAERSITAARVQAQVNAAVTADATLAALRAQQGSLHEDMQRLAKQQTALAREQTALSMQQREASVRAEREARAVMEAAIRNGLTERL
ncbi:MULTISPECIES: M56 family metallopeptidase [Luteimonas]|uniref:M56 family metallopeptidase n=1 Tax=Luteimonas TaxID=83614 RepID=UPI000C7E12F1|nr:MULTISPECIES: M56 family metallopeptidase [Luteimonas]